MSELDPKRQYQSTGNLTKRGDFNARYSNFSWFGWLVEHIAPPTGQVLDIGCGPGWFWRHAANCWSPDRLVLADISEGMLRAAKERLATHFKIDTQVADVAELPFEDQSFDAVVAMHMLYHCPNPERGLAEIARVLKPGGRAIITTVADDDLTVISDLSRKVFGSSGTDLITPVFGGERAAELLKSAFRKVEQHSCHDVFAIDDAEAAIDYITSFPPGITADNAAREAFRRKFDALREAGGGVVLADRRQELFIAEVS